MSTPAGLPGRARRVVANRLDPLAIRRAGQLLRRRSTPGALAGPLAEVRGAMVRDLVRDVRSGCLDAATEAHVAALVEAHLATVDVASPAGTVDAVCAAFENLFQPRIQPVPEPSPRITRAITDSFHRLYYNVSRRTWKDTWYRGVQAYKCPTDMWVYQELVDQLRPGLVVETGTFRGGSALFLADRLELLGHGQVVTIDIDVQPDRPTHSRLTYLTGSSTAEGILAQVRQRLPEDGSPVLVILDADHSEAHVSAELLAYADLVTPGSYLIIEDTNVNGHPTAPDYGPGPWEAGAAFRAVDDRFEIDRRCERYFLTQNPDGFLRRIR